MGSESQGRYGRAKDVEFRSIVGEPFLIVLHAGESKMFSLNGMGVWFWDRLEHPVTQADLLGQMLRDYEVDEVTAAREVERFLNELLQKRLVERLEEPREKGSANGRSDIATGTEVLLH